MAVLTDIKSADWGVSLTGAGNIEQGLADVRQCLDVIFRTKKGSDPLRPQFGSDIYRHIDTPVNVAVANMKLAILEACEIWEKRVQIVSIAHVVTGSQIQFFVNYNLVDSEASDTLQLLVAAGGVIVTGAPQSSLIVEAIFPPGYLTHQMLLSFIIDGNPVLPSPPAFGFSSPANMLTWVRANWGSFGSWYVLPDRLLLYTVPGIAATASLVITVSTLTRYAGTIPTLSPGQHYQVSVITLFSSSDSATSFYSLADILDYVTANFPWGTWVIETNMGVSELVVYTNVGEVDITVTAEP